MQINSNTTTPSQQTYTKTNNQNLQKNETPSEEKKEAISLNINDPKQIISINDSQAIRARVEKISEQLGIDYKEEMKDFSKNNINFFEGSLLTAQSSNIKTSVAGLLSE